MLHVKIIKQVPNDQMHVKQTQQRLKLGCLPGSASFICPLNVSIVHFFSSSTLLIHASSLFMFCCSTSHRHSSFKLPMISANCSGVIEFDKVVD